MKLHAFCLIAALVTGVSFAGDVSWVSASSGDFSTPQNWTPVRVPTAGDTAKIGNGLYGSFTVTQSAQDYIYGADALLWYADAAVRTFDGRGSSSSLPARSDDGYAEMFFAVNDAAGAPFLSVARTKVIEKDAIPTPAAATDAQMAATGVVFRTSSANGVNEFHFDAGSVNFGDPDGTALANTVFVGESYDADDAATTNLTYIHGGELRLPVLNYMACSKGRNLLQFDGGTTTVMKTSCWPDLRTTSAEGGPVAMTKTDELTVTGAGTRLEFLNGFCFARALNSWVVNAWGDRHNNRTLKLTVTDGAELAGSLVSCYPCILDFEVKNGGRYTGSSTFSRECAGIQTRFHGEDATITMTSYTFGGPNIADGHMVVAFTNSTVTGMTSESTLVGAHMTLTNCTGKFDTLGLTGSSASEAILELNDCQITPRPFTYLKIGNGIAYWGSWNPPLARVYIRGGSVTSYHLGMAYRSDTVAASGFLRISDGAQYTVYGNGYIGSAAGVTGRVEVVGTGSVFTHGGAAEHAFYLANVAGSRGEMSITDGGTYDMTGYYADKVRAIGYAGDAVFAVTNATAKLTSVTLAQLEGSTAAVTLADGAVLEARQLLKGEGTATVEADGATIRAKAAGTLLPTGLASAFTVGENGLTLDSNGYDITIGQDFAGSAATLTFAGAGKKTYTGAAAAKAVSVTGGTVDFSSATCANAEVSLAGATTFSLVDGKTNTLEYAGMTIGDELSATIAFEPGDTITLGKPPVIYSVALALSGTFTNDVYSLFRFVGTMTSDSLGAWASAVVASGRTEGKMYIFDTSVDGEGYTHVRLTVADSAPVTEEALWQGAGDTAAWSTESNWTGGAKPNYSKIATFRSESAAATAEVTGAETIGALRFDRDLATAVTGGGRLTLSDSETPFAEAAKGEHTVGVPLSMPKETSFTIASGAKLSFTNNLFNGAVAKTGGGELVLSGDNSFMGKTTLSAGILTFVGLGAFGYNAASPANGIDFNGGTLVYSGETATYASTVTFAPGDGNTAIVKNESDLTLTAPTLTDGAFIKRGAGKLTLQPATQQSNVADDRSHLSNAAVIFPADGSAPADGGYSGFNVAEGELVLKGSNFTSGNGETIIGLNTAQGTADPVLTVDGVSYGAGSSTYHFLIAPTASNDVFYTSPKLKIVNGGSVGVHTLSIGRGSSTTAGTGSYISTKALQPEILIDGKGSYLSISWSPSFSTTTNVATTIRVQNQAELRTRTLGGKKLHLIADKALVCNTNYGSTTNVFDSFSFGDWASVDDSANKLHVELRNGSKFYCKNFVRNGSNGYGNQPVEMDFDGAFWTAGNNDLDITPGRGDCILLDVQKAGLEFEVWNGRTTTVHKAFTGVGDLTKSGPGTLYMGVGLQITKPGWSSEFYKNVTIEVADRPYTIDCGTAIHVKAGTLCIDEGALNPDIAVSLEGGTLEFATGAATNVILAGAGTVKGASLMKPNLCFDSAATSDLAFDGCTLVRRGRFVLTGATLPVRGQAYRVGTWSGTSPSPAGTCWRMDTPEGAYWAKLSVDANGVIWAKFARYGCMLLIR